ncbi:hypothetical protein HDV05_002105 [Chytridiales sp. JEL 0842]|nr:hypothetical protein HDV05_002105 [Chytridiales sp. JEL 0842]
MPPLLPPLTPFTILSPHKPTPTPTLPPLTLLEITLDDLPTLKGPPDEAPGTDLSGTLVLELGAQGGGIGRCVVEFVGAQSLGGNAVGGSNGQGGEEWVYSSSHEVHHPNPTDPPLPPGPHFFRFLFKIPGTLPTSNPNKCTYLLRATVYSPTDDQVLGSLTEEVQVRRVVYNEDDFCEGGGGGLPAYGGGLPSFEEGAGGMAGYDEELPPPPPLVGSSGGSGLPSFGECEDAGAPPGYSETWKGKERSVF